MAQACEHDRLPVQVMGMTRGGLVEVLRPRGRVGLQALMARACPVCAGSGLVADASAAALEALRQAIAAGPRAVIVAAADVARALDEQVAPALAEAGQKSGATIAVERDDALAPGAFEIRPAG